VLEQAGAEKIAAASLADAAWLPKLLTWIDDRHVELSQQPGLRSRLRQVSLWPSGGELRTLNGLAVPGNFQDPLNLARLVEPIRGGQLWPSSRQPFGSKVSRLANLLDGLRADGIWCRRTAATTDSERAATAGGSAHR